MDRSEAIQVLETIRDIYSKYEVSWKKAQMLIPQLKQMDYELIEKLFAHVATCPYPPTITEIAAYPVEGNDHLERIKKVGAWKHPRFLTKIKQVFHQQMVKLVTK